MIFIVSLQAMLKSARLIVCYVVLTLLLSSCNEYNQLLKSNDIEKKYEMAIKYYEDKNYYRAFPLLEELVSLYRGTDKAEKIYYYYAFCNYYMGEYDMANYHFKNFAKTYPNSSYAEECLFMNAYTYYINSPEPSLDQTNTLSAISELQLFIDKYPNSSKVAEANELIDKLRLKLETKAYHICKQYYRTQNYKSVIVSIAGALKDFPGLKYHEELTFLVIKSNYLFAINSIESKKKERLESTVKAYQAYINKYPKGEYVKEAESIYENALKELNKQPLNS